jgi:hypothetical protein
MKTATPRRLDIWDALILVIATAVGFVLRSATAASGAEEPSPGDGSVILGGIDAARPFLVTWTLTFLILRLRRPHPRWRMMARQPGMAACGVATLVLIGLIVGICPEPIFISAAPGSSPVAAPAPGAPVPARLSRARALLSSLRANFPCTAYAEDASAGAWLIMALGGWWRPERSGIDRLGRALGAAWIAVMVARFTAGLME